MTNSQLPTADRLLLRCGLHSLDLTTPVVMGILNVTPDSFSDGGRFEDPATALEHALAMVEAGAAIIDVGGESTRPGAADVSEAEELQRVVPIVERLVAAVSVPISVDTSRARVMRAAIEAGASMINDVRALTQPDALETVANSDVAVCLMHMQGEPRSMQQDPRYQNVVNEVRDFLGERAQACVAAGIGRDRVALDPGIGFGKRLQDNLALLAQLPILRALGYPMLIGVSRKSMLAALLNRGVDERLAGGLAMATAAMLSGVNIVRVHDVAETVDAAKVAAALRAAHYRIGE